MSIIKSNSALIAFDESALLNSNDFDSLNFIQSMSLDIKSNRINSKHIGSSTSLVSQFTEPDITLSISYYQVKDFFNELFFGVDFVTSINEGKSFFNRIIQQDFFNKNAFVIFNNIQGYDLVYSKLNSLMSSISIGQLYLNNYSISYKINEMPIVNVDFSCGRIKIEKISSALKLKNWDDTEIQLDDTIFSDLKSNTRNADLLILTMNGLSISNNFTQTYSPGVIIDSLLNGVIQSLETSINFNRSKFYFLNSTNYVSSRKIILPVIGSLKISGISSNLNIGNIKTFFDSNSSFNMYINVLDEKKAITSIVAYENLVVESFSYKININGLLEYSLECSFQITDTSGFKVIKYGISSFFFSNILSSELEDVKTSDGFYLYAKTKSSP